MHEYLDATECRRIIRRYDQNFHLRIYQTIGPGPRDHTGQHVVAAPSPIHVESNPRASEQAGKAPAQVANCNTKAATIDAQVVGRGPTRSDNPPPPLSESAGRIPSWVYDWVSGDTFSAKLHQRKFRSPPNLTDVKYRDDRPTDAAPRVSVIVPTYRRPSSLSRCLGGLSEQTRPADEIVVVARESDRETLEVVREAMSRVSRSRVRLALVHRPGVMAAMQAGLETVTGDIVAVTDDDAIPRPDWLGGLLAHYTVPNVGAVGGRDVVHTEPATIQRKVRVVGKLSWFGRLTGNHHQESEGPRYVDCLKGVNMSFRTAAVDRFDTELRGDGYLYELDTCFKVRRSGFLVVWDPMVQVDHYPAPRPDEHGRDIDANCAARAYNHWVVLRRHLSPGRMAIVGCWVWLIGDRSIYGVARVLFGWLREPGQPHFRRFVEAARGRLDAMWAS